MHGQIQLITFLFAADAETRPHGEVSQGACAPVLAAPICASAEEGNQKMGQNSSEEAAGARLRLVGSLRGTARAWGFSHHENPLAKPGCPSSIGAVAAGGAARKEHIIHTYTRTPRDYVPASGESSAAFRTTAARQKKNGSVSGESSKVLSAPGPEALWKD